MTLPLMHPSALAAQLGRAGTVALATHGAAHANYLFAARIPYLPLPAFAHAANHSDEQEALNEAVNQYIAIVRSLSGWAGAGFSFRLYAQPLAGVIHLYLVFRLPARAPDEAAAGFLRIGALFRGYRLPLEPVTDSDELARVLNPFAQPFCVDVYQQEAILQMDLGKAFVVYPFGTGRTHWDPWLATLLSLPDECMISLYFEPTALWQDERDSLNDAVTFTENWSVISAPYYGTFRELRDPVAAEVAEIYRDWDRRLGPACAVAVAQFASPSAEAAASAAYVFAAQLQGARTTAKGTALRTGDAIVAAKGTAELGHARRNLATVAFEPWAPTLATPGKEWFRYLADPETAALLFRLPVPVRGEIPGVETRRVF